MTEVMISIGSNLGNRKKNIEIALQNLTERIHLIKVSSMYKTPPQEGVKGGWFLNGVIMGQTSLSPLKLLKFLQSIEQKLGRPMRHKKNSERTIDLDILFYGDKIIRRKNLLIPHPKLPNREFVLKGLMQINPEFVHPETGKKIKQIWRELKNGNRRKKRTYKKDCEKSAV
ncbi:MAG: 2-amino-4-hydroxy-6-hydroxymethyldihydropteridine diphosphokinase [bacterium]|nr:2-amino-4-hydroxy-6-hydroxymethyldihydropteridine diphosphokinase [bacterium]